MVGPWDASIDILLRSKTRDIERHAILLSRKGETNLIRHGQSKSNRTRSQATEIFRDETIVIIEKAALHRDEDCNNDMETEHGPFMVQTRIRTCEGCLSG